jgi:hypothetical protein
MSGTVTNKATSAGFSWTTGRVAVSAMGAQGTPELFTIIGTDGSRSALRDLQRHAHGVPGHVLD